MCATVNGAKHDAIILEAGDRALPNGFAFYKTYTPADSPAAVYRATAHDDNTCVG